MADELSLDLEHGRLTISRDAVAEIVAETALACYGVVGLSAGSRVGHILRREGISVEGDARVRLHALPEERQGHQGLATCRGLRGSKLARWISF